MMVPPTQPKSRGKSKKPPPMRNNASSSTSSFSPYHQAASMLNEVWTRRVSLKSLAFGATTTKGDKKEIESSGIGLLCSKTAYAQASNVLSCQDALDVVVHRHRNTTFKGAGNAGLLYVLLYELLEGPNRAIKGGGALKRMILKIEADLRRDWEELTAKNRHATTMGTSRTPRSPVEDDNNDAPDIGEGPDGTANRIAHHPRYVRVNTLQTTTASIVKRLNDRNIPFQRDDHVPDLLIIPTRDADTTQQLVGLVPHVVLQDKSSCLPALCLVHGYHDAKVVEDGPRTNHTDYMDACAAPGNKTIHLAALVSAALDASDSQSVTTVHAFDKDPRRCRDLATRVDQHAAKDSSHHLRVKVECRDFLSVPPTSFPNVGSILLDPTCSGSGSHRTSGHGRIGARGGGKGEDDDDDNSDRRRLQSLSRFQLAALRHAMSFPHCQRIVYSTCSIHDVENECVVAEALKTSNHEESTSYDPWTVVPPRCLSTWKRRGRAVGGLTPEQASSMIRVDPDHDETGGFFVACLERRSKSASPGTASSAKKRSSGGSDHPDEVGRTVKRRKGSRASVANPETADVVATQQADDLKTIDPKGAKKDRPSNDSPSCKKRLKKLQWKQRQREEKERRLKQNKS